jgi:hypothetical protein
LKRFRPKGNHVQNEIYVFGTAGVFDGELDCLRAGNDEVLRRPPERRE